MNFYFLGTRGSMPTGGAEFLKYGSDTSSYLAENETDAIFFDAGTGICHTPEVSGKKVSIIFSHLHLDHLMGLPFFSLLNKTLEITLYSALDPHELKGYLDRIFTPPFWPCTLSDYKAKISYKKLEEKEVFGDICLFSMEGNHPGGCKVFRIEEKGKSITLATDYEGGPTDSALINFALSSDYLVFDGQYTKEEYEKYRGFGHSTKEMGIDIAIGAKISNVVFAHHDPRHTDEFLDLQEKEIKKLFENAHLAKQGEVIKL